MSFHAVSWVLKHSPAELGARLVLISLADHASPDGTDAYASVSTLQAEARLSRRSVQRALRELEAHHAIRPAGRGLRGQVNYTISFDLTKQSWGANLAPVRGDTVTQETGADLTPVAEPKTDGSAALADPSAAGGVNLTQRHLRRVGGDTVSPKPSIGTVHGTSTAYAVDVPETVRAKDREPATAELQADGADVSKLAADLRPFVEPVRERLGEVAAAKPGAIAPSTAAVARLLGRFPRKDFIPLADDYAHWALHGRGAGRAVRDVVRAYRNWVEREPDVLRQTPPKGAASTRRPSGEDWRVEDTRRRLEEANR